MELEASTPQTSEATQTMTQNLFDQPWCGLHSGFTPYASSNRFPNFNSPSRPPQAVNHQSDFAHTHSKTSRATNFLYSSQHDHTDWGAALYPRQAQEQISKTTPSSHKQIFTASEPYLYSQHLSRVVHEITNIAREQLTAGSNSYCCLSNNNINDNYQTNSLRELGDHFLNTGADPNNYFVDGEQVKPEAWSCCQETWFSSLDEGVCGNFSYGQGLDDLQTEEPAQNYEFDYSDSWEPQRDFYETSPAENCSYSPQSLHNGNTHNLVSSGHNMEPLVYPAGHISDYSHHYSYSLQGNVSSPSSPDEGFSEPLHEDFHPVPFEDRLLPNFPRIQQHIDSERASYNPVIISHSPSDRKKAVKDVPLSHERRKPGRKPGQTSNVLHLWEFMRDLLQGEADENVIKWMDKREGVFQVVNSSEVARLWGEKKKNKKKMTYEKLSRSLRYSRLEGYFHDVPKDKGYPKKLCFKFGPKARDWH